MKIVMSGENVAKYQSSEAEHVYKLVEKLRLMPKARLYYYFALATIAQDGAFSEDPEGLIVDWIGGMIGLIAEEFERRGINVDLFELQQQVRGVGSVN